MTEQEMKENVEQRLYRIKMTILSWCFIAFFVVIVCISFYLYFFISGIWVMIFDKILNWGIPSIITYFVTRPKNTTQNIMNITQKSGFIDGGSFMSQCGRARNNE